MIDTLRKNVWYFDKMFDTLIKCLILWENASYFDKMFDTLRKCLILW